MDEQMKALKAIMLAKHGVELKVRDNDELMDITADIQAQKMVLAEVEKAARDTGAAIQTERDIGDYMQDFYSRGNTVD